MPPAVLIPVAIAGATMLSQNMQNKASQKNNQNQQSGAVQNAIAARDNAAARMKAWETNNPSPFGNTSVAQPTPYGATGPNVSAILGPGSGAAPARQLGNPMMNPQVMAMIRQAIAMHARPGAPMSVAPPGPM